MTRTPMRPERASSLISEPKANAFPVHPSVVSSCPAPASPPPSEDGGTGEDDELLHSDAREILCRVFDDVDEAAEEWRAWYTPTAWLNGYRALGAFIATRLEPERAARTRAEQERDEAQANEAQLWEQLQHARAALTPESGS